jgi:hypothetical protein
MSASLSDKVCCPLNVIRTAALRSSSASIPRSEVYEARVPFYQNFVYPLFAANADAGSPYSIGSP